ncbi:hypothetical protein ACFQ3R_11280 [Mesonia ostreae]|uniref:Uncharacterized protein n=1 Tax=Mesonia ostreae TaxID=861110 RepID=A0ABU2KH33_9FLAO|nr:hypothetical protein [Mesonia ostreae]MDT0293963.1 hypothetical protein [Mesonia ostreae]
MENFDILNIIYYTLFSIFIYYQQLHSKEFRGESQLFHLILNIFAFSGMIIGFAYLIFYGYKTVWWAPFIILIIGILTTFFSVFIERITGKITLSLIGFVLWPVFAYLMFTTIPTS